MLADNWVSAEAALSLCPTDLDVGGRRRPLLLPEVEISNRMSVLGL